MEDLERIKAILELIGTILITISATILIFKLAIKKIDKNNNGKIEKEEITNADIEFTKELLKESFKTIAKGIFLETGLSSKKSYNLMLNEIKKNKNLIEETIKIEGEKNNEKNSEKN